jgi:hypothetical protein
VREIERRRLWRGLEVLRLAEVEELVIKLLSHSERSKIN